MAAFSAKFELWGIGGGATRTCQGQLSAALPAEFHPCWVFKLAFPTFHGFPRWNVEKGPTVEVLVCEDKQSEQH